MNKEIAEKIQMIKEDRIPDGYKKSTIGTIPIEWATKELSHYIVSLNNGISVNAGDRPAKEGEIGILKTSSVTINGFKATENKVIINVLIGVPNNSEQEKITNILSNWDKAIELKQKLLQEKQKQKKGLMERLLTEKIRINGFNEKWKKVKLGTADKEIDLLKKEIELLKEQKKGLMQLLLTGIVRV